MNKPKVKFPKPIFRETIHHVIKPDGSKWLTSRKPGSALMPGYRWEKEHFHKMEVFYDDKGASVHLGSLDNPTVKDIDRVIEWLKQVRKAIGLNFFIKK